VGIPIIGNITIQQAGGGLGLNFILIGAPNSGKSTLGKRAAGHLGMRFYDTDLSTTDHIRFRNQESMFFQLLREFPATEQVVVRKIAKEAENAVIATGADTVLSPKNAQVLRKCGLFIYIKRDMDRMLEEAKKHVISKPGQPEKRDANELMVYLYREVMPDYEKLADFTLENYGDEETGLAKLAEIIQANRQTTINR
jgi:shikimate kinase